MLPILLALSSCLPPSHPGIAVEASTPYPGISAYAPHWGAPAGYIPAAHLTGQRVLGVHGLHDDLTAQALAGYDLLVLDEPMWQGQTTEQVSITLALARQLAPGMQVGVVEPYAASLDQLLAAGARPDFVSGETYAGDVSVAELSGWAWQYGVSTQMWATGTNEVMGLEHRVDLVIAVDLGGSWGGPDYGDALYQRLSLSCRLVMPLLIMDSNPYP